ncbi:DoxX family protein [Pseudoalteromonas fenneropenaei]|uniref:DoxX family protein n=1 Tax=Pseudoalteromonas fenneropenaei TaxID=1737459 RepID=A0ABV7CFG1_9GAMM
MNTLVNTFINPSKTLTDLVGDIAALLLRLILAPVMIIAGYSKLNLGNDTLPWWQRLLADDNVVSWFGNSEWGLGLPFADFLAFSAGWLEFLGGWLLLFGLFTRLVSIPLAAIMLVAMFSVHWQNGWFAITPTSAQTSPAQVLAWLQVPGASESLSNSSAAAERLQYIKEMISDSGYSAYLHETGSVVILNNGIEFAASYFVMLLVLFAIGGGRFSSLDHWLFASSRKRE